MGNLYIQQYSQKKCLLDKIAVLFAKVNFHTRSANPLIGGQLFCNFEIIIILLCSCYIYLVHDMGAIHEAMEGFQGILAK